jgi:hypothetical protein
MPDSARYILPNHETFTGIHTRADLYMLVERGSLARGEIVVDQATGRSHRVGEILQGMTRPRSSKLSRPSYRELEGDAPWEGSVTEEPAAAFEAEEEEVFEEVEEVDDSQAILPESDEEEEEEEEEEDPELLLYYHEHPSWLAFTKWLLLSVLCVTAGILGIEYFSLGAVAVGMGLGSLILCCCIISRQHQDYMITGSRAEMEWGIFGRSSKEVRIVDIRSIDVHESGLLGLLNVGTVDFSSSGTDGVEVQFKNIRYPHHVKELVRKLQAMQAD